MLPLRGDGARIHQRSGWTLGKATRRWDMPTTETFVETRRNKITSWQTRVTVTRVPAAVSDLSQTARWLLTVGVANIVSVELLKIERQSVDFPSSHPYVEEGFEVRFACGAVGYVNRYREQQELDALVVGTDGYLHGLAVWRKRGHIVGSPVPWIGTKFGRRARLNPDRLPRCCAAELYARAQGRPWGVSTH